MKLATQYDVICAGGGISNYLCAALLVKLGIKVLLVDENDRDQNGFYLEALTLSDLNRSSVFSKILKELGMDDLEQSSVPLDAITQVISPTYRLVLGQTKDATSPEIFREFLGDGKVVGDFFNRLYQVQDLESAFLEEALTLELVNRSTLNQWKKHLGSFYRIMHETNPIAFNSIFQKNQGAEIEKLALALLGSLSYATPSCIGAAQSIRGLTLAIQKRSLLLEGKAGLKKRLLEFILSRGSQVKHQTKVKSLITTQKKITGMLLSSHEGIVEGKIFILGSKLQQTYATLPESLQQASVLQRLRKVTPTHWRYTFQVELHRDALPIGVTQNMVIISSFERPLEEENFLSVQLKPHQDQIVTCLVTALIPYQASSIKSAYLRIASAKILHVLCHVMPFLEQNMIRVDPDFRKGTEALKSRYPFNGLDDVPEHLLQYYVQGAKRAQDFWGLPWVSPHLNLYFTGRQLWPSLGFTGEVLSAKKIYDDVKENHPLQGRVS